MIIENITRPTLLLDKKKAIANIDRMASKAERNHVQFRPHFKTIQSKKGGELFRKRGIKQITVSSVKMAEYFADGGWNDITIAFPINTREAHVINQLAAKIKLNILVVNAETVEILSKKITEQVGVFLKIDVGTHRTGILPSKNEAIENIIQAIEEADYLNFAGFLAHAGHSYRSRSKKEIMEAHDSSMAILNTLKNKYQPKYPQLKISSGDTPTCSLAEQFTGADEIRPGNFVFYDLMQVQIGSCNLENIAVALAAPVVAKHPDRNEIIIHGGGVHLSKDKMTIDGDNLNLDLKGKTIFGVPVILNDSGWQLPEKGNYMRSLSQEHGVVSCTPNFFDKIKIGDLIGVLPVHSCMLVDLMDEMLSLDGEVMDLI